MENYFIDTSEDLTHFHDFALIENPLLNICVLEEKYELEAQFMNAVSQGRVHRAESIMKQIFQWQFESRTSNSLRNMQNYLIILNTLLRISAVQGAVHPFHIDRISSKYAKKIERLSSEKAGQHLCSEMIQKYCLLVKNHSLKGYSFLIRKVISHIDFDLTADLSLKAISSQLNVNPSYLSTLFRKETGTTLTKYVNQKRIEHALFLLNSTHLQIQVIAQYCGIPDVNYFTKTFKKIMGLTPKEYKKTSKS